MGGSKGKIGKKINDPQNILHQNPDGKRKKKSHRVKQSSNHKKKPQTHEQWNNRHYKNIGNDRNQGNLAKIPDENREREHLGRERHGKELACRPA